MPQFQLRYQGAIAPEPETLFADNAVHALARARRRFDESEGARAILLADGVVLHVFDRAQPDEDAANLEQLLAAAGIYEVGPPTS